MYQYGYNVGNVSMNGGGGGSTTPPHIHNSFSKAFGKSFDAIPPTTRRIVQAVKKIAKKVTRKRK